jgi:hypothetical protein
MLGLRKKGPTRPFSHTSDCKILRVDPGVKIPWNEIETGLWVAECQCGKQWARETPADQRVRLDPLDPSTSRHAPQCEQGDATDPAVLRAILKVRDGADGGYWWVECGICDHGWQVPHYGAVSVA